MEHGARAVNRSTPASLRLRVLALLLCVAALWATMGLTFGGAHGAVSDTDARAVPTVADTAQVGYFLADADRVAAESLLVDYTVRSSRPTPTPARACWPAPT